MIKITCAKCQTVLEIDDGFAGGICRCQHCKAIQTVPRRAKVRPDAPEGTEPSAKPVPIRPAAPGGAVSAPPQAHVVDATLHKVDKPAGRRAWRWWVLLVFMAIAGASAWLIWGRGWPQL